MYLKIDKRKNYILCCLRNEKRYIPIGTIYNFSLVSSTRQKNAVKQKNIVSLGTYTQNEYKPINTGMETVHSMGSTHSRKFISVNSFDLEDESSFQKILPEKPIRFYSTFYRKLNQATSEYKLSNEFIQNILTKVMQILPTYSEDDYAQYIYDEVKNLIKHEATKNGDLEKIIRKVKCYELCDYIVFEAGHLKGYKVDLNLRVDYNLNMSLI